jgi:dihydropyrimidinase
MYYEDSNYLFYEYFQGKIEVTIAGGRVVWENNELKVAPGTGKYIEMPPYSYLFDGLDKKDAIYQNSLQAPVKRAKSTS